MQYLCLCRFYCKLNFEIETGSSGSSINPLAALIAPLAGLALLGAASAVAVNPVLLQLVTISRKRRKRDIDKGWLPKNLLVLLHYNN